MNRERYYRMNNKGAAMVTVLIAVTFIGILATSLMYMAYMNYLTKAMRYNATDNFYTSEFALDDLSSSLQQSAVDLHQSSVAGTISHLKTDVLNVHTNGGVQYYDNTAVASLIKNATELASVSVNTVVNKDGSGIPTESNYEEGANYVLLKGVEITTTTDSGYVSTISSDIKLEWEPVGNGEMDVNDFSILSDAPILVNKHDAIIGGNLYLHSAPDYDYDDYTGTRTTEEQRRYDAFGSRGRTFFPKGTAITLYDVAKLTILSRQAIIEGDIRIGSGSVLNINGDVRVYGKIILEDNATLQVSGTLKTRDGIYYKNASGAMSQVAANSKCTVVGASSLAITGEGASMKTTGYDRLVAEIISDIEVVPLYNDNPVGSWYELSLFDFQNKLGGGAGYQWMNASGPIGEPNSSDTNVKVCLGNSDNINGMKNMLNISARPVKLRGTLSNSTVVTSAYIEFFDETVTTYMTTMDDVSYAAAKNILLCTSHEQFDLYNPSTHVLEYNLKLKFYTGLVGSGIYGKDANGYLNITAAGFTPRTLSGTGHNNRRVYFNNSTKQNAIPVGYFLRDDASTTITTAFANVSGSSDPSEPNVMYYNWNKQ